MLALGVGWRWRGACSSGWRRAGMRGAGGRSGIDGAPGCRPFRSGRLCITGLVEYAYGNGAATLPEHVPTSAPELFEHGLDASVERGVEELRALAHAVLRFGIIAPLRPLSPFGTVGIPFWHRSPLSFVQCSSSFVSVAWRDEGAGAGPVAEYGCLRIAISRRRADGSEHGGLTKDDYSPPAVSLCRDTMIGESPSLRSGGSLYSSATLLCHHIVLASSCGLFVLMNAKCVSRKKFAKSSS